MRLAVTLLAPALASALAISVWGRATAASLRIESRAVGDGAPTVVLQSGLGDGLSVWQAVQQRLPGTLSSIAYDRPGYGRSEPVDGDRSPCTIAAELHEMLLRSGRRPPYVLAGHSLGGLYQAAYAQLYPDEVAGLVLLEPTHPEHWATLQREVPMLAWTIRLARNGFGAAMRREFDDQAACNDRLAALPMPDVPVRLLVRERYAGLEAGAFEGAMRRLQVDWAARLRTTAERMSGSGHYVQRDRPDAVAEAIIAVAATARSQPVRTDTAATVSQ